MATAQDLIQAALEELGVYAPGETLTDADAERGLWALNGMLDSWSNESLFCYAIQEYTFQLVPGQQSYTVGTGGNINQPRPLRLIETDGAAYIKDTNNNRYGVQIVPRDKWNLIGLLQATSDIPDTIFYDPQFPLGVINVFPTPTQAYTCAFDAYLQLSEFSSLITPLSLPPGYQDAIQHNLAVRLKPYFASAELDPIVAGLAAETKGVIKRNNLRQNIANYDPEIVSKAQATYNIYRDTRGY